VKALGVRKTQQKSYAKGLEATALSAFRRIGWEINEGLNLVE
jgi:hypothetical protein